ncbi:hypothetical protein HMSSN139_67190 [Paenibacillus sp. HMSSN-139]|nr:hypothetical protein HMSSN139_67190 [Paenibacillus sp. HMSSN-139]
MALDNCSLIQRVEEIGLILVIVDAPQQLVRPVLFHDACIMPCRNVIRAEIQRFVQKFAELDFPVAHDVRVWRPAPLIFFEEIGKYFIVILLLEVHGVVGDIDLFADAANVFGVRFGRAVAEFVGIVPVFHEYADDVVALLLQQERGHRGIDAAGHADDDAGFAIRLRHDYHSFERRSLAVYFTIIVALFSKTHMICYDKHRVKIGIGRNSRIWARLSRKIAAEGPRLSFKDQSSII